MTKLSALNALLGSNLTGGALIPVLDTADTTMAPTGTDKKMAVTEFVNGLTALYPNAFGGGAALLAGRAGGQILAGGTNAADALTFKASSNGTPTGPIIFLGGAAGTTELGRMTNAGQLTWSGPLVVGGTSNLFGNVSTSGSFTAVSSVTAAIGVFNSGKTFVGPGVIAEGGNGGLTFVGSELGVPAVVGGVTVGAAVASCIDLRGGRCDSSGNAALNQVGDFVSRLMYAGSTRKPSQPKVGVACINVVASENWTDNGTDFTPTATGSAMEFYTNPNGTTTNHGMPNSGAAIPAMKLGNDASLTVNGNLAIGGTSSLFGNVTTAGSLTAASVVASGNVTAATHIGNLSGTSATLISATAGVFIVGSGGPQIITGNGSPIAGAGVAAPIGSLYLNAGGGASSTLYVKTSAANTGWTAK